MARSALKDCEGLGLRKRDGLDRMSYKGMFGRIPAGLAWAGRNTVEVRVSFFSDRSRAFWFWFHDVYDTGQQHFFT